MAFEASPWPLYPLREFCQPIETADPRRKPEQSFRYIDIASVSNEMFQIVTPKELVGFQAPSRARKRIRAGDVLFATTRPYLRSVALVPIMYDGEVCSTGFCVLRAGDNVLPEWLFYCVLSDALLSQVVQKMRGANYPAVTDRDVYESKIPVPPVDEQRRIVARIKECLSRVDEIKRLREETRQDVVEVFSSLLSEFFDPAWPCKPLGSLAIDIRNGWSGREKKAGNLAKMLRLSAVHSRTIDPAESKDILLDKADIEAFRVAEDDVFVVRGNGSKHLVGRSAIAASTYDTVVFNDLLIRLRFTPDILPAFANYALHLPALRRQIEERAKTAAGIWKVNQTHLSELLIPCPKLSDQSAAIERIERATRVCEHLAAGLADVDIDLLPQTILRKAFAGEL